MWKPSYPCQSCCYFCLVSCKSFKLGKPSLKNYACDGHLPCVLLPCPFCWDYLYGIQVHRIQYFSKHSPRKAKCPFGSSYSRRCWLVEDCWPVLRWLQQFHPGLTLSLSLGFWVFKLSDDTMTDGFTNTGHKERQNDILFTSTVRESVRHYSIFRLSLINNNQDLLVFLASGGVRSECIGFYGVCAVGRQESKVYLCWAGKFVGSIFIVSVATSLAVSGYWQKGN